jgi:hypothetical protein
MAKKIKPAPQERKRSFSIEPGLGLLLAFVLFIVVVLLLIHIPGARSLSFPIAIWVVAGVMYSKSSIFGIKNNEQAKHWAKYLAILGVILTIFALGSCC